MAVVSSRESCDGALLAQGVVHLRLKTELFKLGVLAVPTIAVMTIGARLVHANIVQILVGRCGGEKEQAAVGLVITIYVPITVAATGFVSTVGVLTSQAVGAANIALAGEWLLTGAIAVSVVGCICCFTCIVFTPSLVTLSIDDHEVQHFAANFSPVFVWSALLFQLFQMARAWFQAQGTVGPFVLAASLGVICNAGFGDLFACHSMGWVGAGLGIVIAGACQLILILLWATCSSGKHHVAWAHANYQSAFAGDRVFKLLRMGGYKALWLVLDEGACMVVSLLTGLLGAAEVATQSIYFLLWALMYGMQMGLSSSISTRVSLHLGADNAPHAKHAMFSGLIAFGLLTTILVALLFLMPVAQLFSNEAEVQWLIDKNLPVLALCITATSAAAATMAPLSNSTEEVRCLALIVAISAWVVGLPMAAFLGFGPLALRLNGVWLGIACGEATKGIAAGLVLARFDWARAANKVRVSAAIIDSNTLSDADSGPGVNVECEKDDSGQRCVADGELEAPTSCQ